jgi:glycosyltransferase involved in cell wall biosynthesis
MLEGTFFAHTLPSIYHDESDVVVAISPSLSALAAAAIGRRGRPLGVIVQDIVGSAAHKSRTTGGRVASAISAVEYRFLRSATLVGVIVESFADVLAAHGVERHRIRLLPNFARIESAGISKLEARVQLGWPADDYLVVHTGNIGKKQGLEVVGEAARLAGTSDLRFVIVGDGNQRRHLQSEYGSLGNIDFVPTVSDALYPIVLAAADQLLICELPGVDEMSLPSKITSYITAGRPIVASVDPAGITGRYLGEYCLGLAAPAGSAGDLLESIDLLRADRMMQESFIGAGRTLKVELGQPAAFERYVDFVEELRTHSAGRRSNRRIPT